MATWDEVARLAVALPDTEEGTSFGNRAWKVKGKAFVWERPLRNSDLEELGPDAPDGEILCARVEHGVAKEAMLADESGLFFTTSHFDGYPMVLVQLDAIPLDDLEEVVTEAWLAKAPAKLVKTFLAEREQG